MIYELPNLEKCTISIIGLGYVGLPLAIEFARCKISKANKKNLERQVIGFDINERRIKELNNGVDKTNETNLLEIKKLDNLIFTNNLDLLVETDVFIVTVPTPIDKKNKPDLKYLERACKIVGSALKENKSIFSPVVIFESTVYPGATEEVCVPILEKNSGLKIFHEINDSKTFGYGYSPERINPGDNKHKLSSIVKVTSGNTTKVSNWIDEFYGSIIKAGTFKATSVKVAEAAKVIENTQRDLNIALINELTILFNRLDIDTLDVLNAAKTKWNFVPFTPGLVGGHCIGVDPYYLTFKSEEHGYSPEVILAGRKINDGMANWFVEKLILEMVNKNMKIKNSNALVLGFTFKENCPDIRNTKVIDIVKALKKYNLNIDVVDPCADQQSAYENYGLNILSEIISNKRYSIIVACLAHDYFMKFDYDLWLSLCNKDYIILDIKGIVPRELNPIRP